MKLSKRLFFLGGCTLAVMFVATPVYAECGGQQQCIAVSIDPQVMPAHGISTPTGPVNFGSQAMGVTSVEKTILVAAVFGPVDTSATLTEISVNGADQADFRLGGTCQVGTMLPHDGAVQAQLANTCTIIVTFNAKTNGTKSASIAVKSSIITRTIPLTGTAGYPDVALDTNVATTLAAQTEAAQRFSRAQINNFQHRMESLHRSGSNAASPASNLNTDISRANGTALLANEVAALLTTQSVNLTNLSDAATKAPAGSIDASGFWTAGMVNFGTREATDSRTGLGFTTSGISLGFDRRFSEQWVAGLGLGFARDTTTIGNPATLNRSQGSSVAVYGSYQPSQTIFVDGMVGVGALKFETQRYVQAANDYARGNRDGNQRFASLAAGYEYHHNDLLVSPYTRLDYSKNVLKPGSETGAGQFALSYFEQTESARQGALGVRAASMHPTSFGYASPRIRAEYQRNFQTTQLATLTYADQPGGQRYLIPASAAERNAFALGIGNDFVLRNGTLIGIDYQYLHTASKNSNYAAGLKFSKNLDDRDVLKMLEGTFLPPDNLGIQVDAGYMFDDNVTRAQAGSQAGSQAGQGKLADSSYSVNLGKSMALPLSDHARVLLSGTVGGESFYQYDGLSRLSGGVLGEFQYRGSADFSTPTLGVFIRTFADQYHSDLRDGHRFSGGISIRQPVTDRIQLFAVVARNQRQSKSDVFDTRDRAARINLDYELSTTSTIYLGGEYRRGNLVTTGPAPSIYGKRGVAALDDAYPGQQIYSYRLDGATVISTLGYNLGFGSRDSIDFSWRRISSKLDDTSTTAIYAVNTPAPSYIANQFTVVYLVRF